MIPLQIDAENLMLRAWILRPRGDGVARWFVYYSAKHDAYARHSNEESRRASR